MVPRFTDADVNLHVLRFAGCDDVYAPTAIRWQCRSCPCVRRKALVGGNDNTTPMASNYFAKLGKKRSQPFHELSFPSNKQMSSLPLPAFNRSLPLPPSSRSLPLSPYRRSLPPPPLTMSLPGPAQTKSLPAPALMTSFPPRPTMMSRPRRAVQPVVGLSCRRWSQARPCTAL